MGIPKEVEDYIAAKSTQLNGRPHFLAQVKTKGQDPTNIVLEICERAWIKNHSARRIGRHMKVHSSTVYRLLQDLEPWKMQLIEYLQETPSRRKTFYNPETDSSDYETVDTYIRRCRREDVRAYKDRLRYGERVWRDLGYKDPQNWTADAVTAYLAQQPPGKASGMLDAIRVIAPQIANKHSPHYISISRYRAKLKKHKKAVFAEEVQLIRNVLTKRRLWLEKDIWELHITLGAREGVKKDSDSGICGLKWENFHKGFTKVDLRETKVRGEMWCRDCPVDQFFKDLPKRLQQLWNQRGKPSGYIIPDRYESGPNSLQAMYKRIRKACKEELKGKVEPDVYKELTTLKPHDSDRIHVNLLWEAEVPLEIVAGQDLGQGEALGLCGRVWLNVETIRKYYLSLSQHSGRYKRLQARIKEFSKRFETRQTETYVS